MRRTGRHAVTAIFEPADDRVRGVLTRGAPLSSAARLVGRGVPEPASSPVSLLLESCDPGSPDGLVRVELLVHPERTGVLLEGVEFELSAGQGPLGCGRVIPEPPADADPPAHPPRMPSDVRRRYGTGRRRAWRWLSPAVRGSEVDGLTNENERDPRAGLRRRRGGTE